MTIADEYRQYGLAAPGREIYHLHKETGSASRWARVLTVAFNSLSLNTRYRDVFVGLYVAAARNIHYRFGTQMWATCIRRQKHFGNWKRRPLPHDPVLELPQELEADETDDDERPDREKDDHDACGVGGARRRHELSEDDHDARGVGGACRRYERSGTTGVMVIILNSAVVAMNFWKMIMTPWICGAGFGRRRHELSQDEDDARGVGGAVTLRDYRELEEEIQWATQKRIDDMMHRLKGIVTTFHEQANLTVCARLEEMLTNTASRDGAECEVQLANALEAKLALLVSM
ncbi:hypothetical protein FN846DRAFT_908578 [Sphaerosporella brunnea]|uniref:Uncharacterized protein n=1 Tax=Sphaerosporella brunnea TaxID=1250544 RepID=A0A5J5EU48_9PEZI|nr:hypothetical protein FN846DRAFT_908578 [Sphaerosporella brunnea]